MDVSGVFEAACHVRHRVAGHVLPMPNRPKENTMSEPIEPDDIRVDDTVVAVSRITLRVLDVDGRINGRGADAEYSLHPSRYKWELVSRPAPKPEVGQHWLNEHGDEYVVLESPTTGSPGFYPMRRTRPTYKPADAAPDGWVLKP